MGVDYELFWTLNPKSLSPFVKAFSLKQEYNDTLAWQYGMYVRLAIGSSFSKDSKYPSKPLLTKKVADTTMSPEEIKARVMAKMNKLNSQFGKE